ncbi:ABC transporter substrate binding protein [Bradyrhizobium lablabi]|uniref:sensor histidine kinase n=1 Tax=Bradyrhizobium lablabi TaxID=722472 RepID=UPI001BA56C6D|nr:ABC transporter substrate binding protein [Bradyrhizobium lablabi]MBR0696626.1 PAS domain-containing protein [Bradyrhizobium lablabi]
MLSIIRAAYLRGARSCEFVLVYFGVAAFSGMTRTRIVRWSLLLLFLYAAESRAAEPQRVLMLHAFNYTFPATTLIADGARKRLLERSPQRLEIDADFLDLGRHTDAAYEARIAEFLRTKYEKRPPDVVITLGSAALPFIVRHRDEIAPNVPVVFTAISPQSYGALQLPPNITGIISEFNLDKTLALAERLQPKATRLFVIAGSGQVDRRWQSVARKTIEGRERNYEVTYLFDRSHAELMEEVKNIPRDAIVVYLTLFADSRGNTFVPAEMAGSLAAASPAPLYAPYDTYIGNGIVGGFVETFESVGIEAADMALQILAGKDPATIAPQTNPGQAYRVDYRALARWMLQESKLPPGTVVLFKKPTIWTEHRGIVSAAILIVALQSLIVAALLIQRRRRLRAENLLKESEERMTFAAAAANIGLWQFDQHRNELWATEHCRAMFGLARDVPLTRDAFLAAVHPDDLQIATQSLQRSLEPEQSAISDVRIILPGEEVRWVRMRARSRSDGDGRPDHLGGIFIDITEQKSAEAEVALQRREVEHLMRVSVLGELSGSIAHEVNQPLTAILSNAQAALHLLAQESPDLIEIRDALEEIVHEDNRAGEVIHRLRGLLRKGERKAENVNINDLVRSTISLLNSELIGRDIVARLDLENTVFLTRGDSVQLQQVLLNLVMNAMDAMASTPMTQRFILISTRAVQTGMVDVRVKDRGHGIRPKENGRVFEPFYTTKDHGLGLGLTLCSTIIQAHQGRLTLVNDDGGGAVAVFSLPIQQPATGIA